MTNNPENTILIIDGNSLINRAYFAIRNPMITKEGVYTHGVYGFLTMLNKILTTYHPAYAAVTFDLKGKTFRHEAYDDYKGTRKGMPPELAMQMDPLKYILKAMNFKIFEQQGYEADDVIGTISRLAEEHGLEPLIVTGDRDALQLATDKAKVLITKKGISEFELYDKEAFIAKYGFTPTQFIDLKGLMGDTSDNIPGIKGVGEKTATKLILDYGSVEGVIEHVDELKGKLKERVEDDKMMAVLSKKLATIFTSVPLEIDFDMLKVVPPDIEALVPLYKKYEFNKFLNQLTTSDDTIQSVSDGPAIKLAGAIDLDIDNDSSGEDPNPAYEQNTYDMVSRPTRTVAITSSNVGNAGNASANEIKSLLAQYITSAESKDVIIKVLTDSNHVGVPIIYGIGLMHEDAAIYVKTESDDDLFVGFIYAFVDLIQENHLALIGHNIGDDLFALLSKAKSFALADKKSIAEDTTKILVQMSTMLHAVTFDTSVCEYLLQEGATTGDLKTIAYRYFSTEVKSEDEFYKEHQAISLLDDGDAAWAEYALDVNIAIASLYKVQSKLIEDKPYTNLYYDTELPLVATLAQTESNGFDFDKIALDEVSVQVKSGIETLTREIWDIAGEEFNIKSPKQLGVILFEKMGLKHGKKTKTGYSTNVDVLHKLIDESPIIEKVLEYRTLTKLDGTYIEGLIPLVGWDGRIHTKFQQTVTATGRLSSTNPNLQNIPTRQSLGKLIRKAFSAGDEDYVLVGADYSQIELRIMAHLSGDPMLIGDFNSGADIHTRTAARVFGLSEEDVTPLLRSRAKAVNFGIIYGMSGFGLSEDLDIGVKEAEKYIADYFSKHEMVKEYLDDIVTFAKAHGYVETMYGRVRRIPEINQNNYNMRQFGERLAMNTPIQGAAADIIKIAMVRVQKALDASGLDAELILQVHDELIIRAHKDIQDEVSALITREMQAAAELKVPLIAEAAVAKNWYDLK
ncbi:MAG: DNA polymerase I [Clostridiales Family XIII bacterium]|jgi:DNA polymerase-1|nr:DNA polymerase I [Clostridiales Family XIII bacterium]